MKPATIYVRHRFVAFHAWPEARGERAYLGERHRHEFHVEVRARVMHDERDIEFHDLKDALVRACPPHGLDLGGSSCETIGRTLLDKLDETWPGRILSVDVSEDGECGAVVESSRVTL